jgi:competence protein ComEA
MPEIPFSRGRVLAGAFVLLVVLVFAGRFVLRSGTASTATAASVEPIRATPAPRLVVHVVGGVRRPGLYRLPQGSRIADAVARAGGPAPQADLELVNLAAKLADGVQVVVPRRAPPASATGAAAADTRGAAAAGPVHLNTATLEQLDALPGVGPVTAQKILDYRQKHGAFSSVDDLDAIPGIGPARLEQLRDLVAP